MDQNASESGKNSKFFPVRNWIGGKHKKNGVYIEDNTIRVHKASGYKANSATFEISEISHIAHLRKFKFLFLIVVYTWQFTHSIIFMNNEGGALSSLAFRNFRSDDLREILQEIVDKNTNISLDPAVKDFVETGSKTKLTMNMIKAVLKGLLPWVGIVIGIFLFLLLTQ